MDWWGWLIVAVLVAGAAVVVWYVGATLGYCWGRHDGWEQRKELYR